MTDDDASRTPIDQALEVLVYLPVGLVFELPRSIPRFIDRGREQVSQACSIGLEVIGLASRDPAGRMSRVREHTAAALRGLGVVPPEDDEPSAPASAPTLSVVSDLGVATNGTTNGATRPAPTSAPTSPRGPSGPPPDPSGLAIPGYDSLSASQVVPRLDGLTLPELETVRTYEQATRGRKTILSKIAQIQAS